MIILSQCDISSKVVKNITKQNELQTNCHEKKNLILPKIVPRHHSHLLNCIKGQSKNLSISLLLNVEHQMEFNYLRMPFEIAYIVVVYGAPQLQHALQLALL